jgi:hypothetical protein
MAIEDLQSMGYTIDYDLVEDGVESKGLKKSGMQRSLTL